MADLVWFKSFQFFDASGDPLNAGTINIYDATTTNERTVYQDSAAAVPWTQPITLGTDGRLTAPIYVPTGAWKYLLKNSAGSTITSEDNIPGAVATGSVTSARPATPTLSKSANYTIAAADLGKYVEADATGGSFTLTLLSAITAGDGAQLWVQNIGTSGKVTVAAAGGQTINGATSIPINGQYSTLILKSNGANWTALVDRPIPTLSKTADYTVKHVDEGRLILCDCTAGQITVTLPTVALAGSGFRVGIKKIDSSTANALILDGAGSETVDGATTLTMTTQWGVCWVRCDGTTWNIESRGHSTSARFTTLEIGAASDTTVARASAGVISVEGSNVLMASNLGLSSIWVPAVSMTPNVTNGPSRGAVEVASNLLMLNTLDFDTTTAESAQFAIEMPISWDLGTVTAKAVWKHAATTVNFGVVWDVAGGAYSDNETPAAFGTAVTITDTGGVTNNIYLSPTSAAITIANTPAAGDWVAFRVRRAPANGSDTLAIDAGLLGVSIFYTITALKDG